MKYRKKPIVVTAFQWLGNISLPEEFEDMGCMEDDNGYDLIIMTLEGDMRCRMDDFIIKGVNGEFYPCKPDIFFKTYEKVEE